METSMASCGCANIVGQAFYDLGCIDCGTACCPSCAVPLESGLKTAPETPPKAERIHRALLALGMVHLTSLASVIALTSLLNMKAGASTRWAAVARLLP